jgi:hypothetical protein
MKSRILAFTTCLLIVASTSAIVCAGDNAGGFSMAENYGFVISPGGYAEGFSSLDATIGQGDYDIVWFIVLGAGNLNLQVEDLYIPGDTMIASGQLLIGGPASFADWATSPDIISLDVGCPDFAIGLLIMAYYDCPGGFPAGYTWRASMFDCDIVGTWDLTYDWSCNGTVGYAQWYIYADGTFATSTGYTGTWTLFGDQVTMYYDMGTTYWGTVASRCIYMSGEMESATGTPGCWWADKTALASAETSPDEVGDSGGL